jgi:hypothetical protein
VSARVRTMRQPRRPIARKAAHTRHRALFEATRSSLSSPRATIRNESSGNGRRGAFASSHSARLYASRSSSVIRTTGIAFGWNRLNTASAVIDGGR